MPIPPTILQHIQAIRKFISSGGAGGASDPGLHLLIHKLFQNPDKIVSDADTLDAILALAEARPEPQTNIQPNLNIRPMETFTNRRFRPRGEGARRIG